MVAAIIVVALVSVVVVGVTLVASTRHSEQGWLKAAEAEKTIREHQTARITTLENRLLSHRWEDFANLQMVPDETAKATWAGQYHEEQTPNVGQSAEEMAQAHFRSNGSDLEGENLFDGPTIG